MPIEINPNKQVELTAFATNARGDIDDVVLFEDGHRLRLVTERIDTHLGDLAGLSPRTVYNADFDARLFDGRYALITFVPNAEGAGPSYMRAPPDFPVKELLTAHESVRNWRGEMVDAAARNFPDGPFEEFLSTYCEDLMGAISTVKRIFSNYGYLAGHTESGIDDLFITNPENREIVPVYLVAKFPWGRFYNPGCVEYDGEKLQLQYVLSDWHAIVSKPERNESILLLDSNAIQKGTITLQQVPLELAVLDVK